MEAPGRSVGRSARKAKREEMDWTLLKTEPRAARAKGECGFVGVGGREDGNGGGSRKRTDDGVVARGTAVVSPAASQGTKVHDGRTTPPQKKTLPASLQ